MTNEIQTLLEKKKNLESAVQETYSKIRAIEYTLNVLGYREDEESNGHPAMLKTKPKTVKHAIVKTLEKGPAKSAEIAVKTKNKRHTVAALLSRMHKDGQIGYAEGRYMLN